MKGKASRVIPMLVYCLFAAIVIMFIVLVVVFFKGGSHSVEVSRLDIPAKTETISLFSNFSKVDFLPTDEQEGYITYEKQIFKEQSDDVTFNQSGKVLRFSIDRLRQNSLSNLFPKAAKIEVHVPRDKQYAVMLELTAGEVDAGNCGFTSLEVKSAALDMTLDGCQTGSFKLKSNVGRIQVLSSRMDTAEVNMNLGDVEVDQISIQDGQVTARYDLSLGLVSADTLDAESLKWNKESNFVTQKGDVGFPIYGDHKGPEQLWKFDIDVGRLRLRAGQ